MTSALYTEPRHVETLLVTTIGRRADGALEAVVRFPDGSAIVSDAHDPDNGLPEPAAVLHDTAHALLAAHLGLDRSPVLERVVDLRPLTVRDTALEEAATFALQAWCAALRGEDHRPAAANALSALERATTGAEDECAECGRPFTPAEWDARHTGRDPLTDIHETCCVRTGPCSDPV